MEAMEALAKVEMVALVKVEMVVLVEKSRRAVFQEAKGCLCC